MKKAPFLALVAVIVLLIGMWPPWPAGSQTTGITSQTQVVNSTAAAGTSSVIALDGKYSNCTVIAQTSTSTASVVVYGNTQATQYGPAAPNAVNSNFGSSGTITATTTQSQTSGNVANLPVGFYFTWSGNSGTLYAWAVCSSAIARAAAGATGAPGPTGPTGPPGPTGSPGAGNTPNPYASTVLAETSATHFWPMTDASSCTTVADAIAGGATGAPSPVPLTVVASPLPEPTSSPAALQCGVAGIIKNGTTGIEWLGTLVPAYLTVPSPVFQTLCNTSGGTCNLPFTVECIVDPGNSSGFASSGKNFIFSSDTTGSGITLYITNPGAGDMALWEGSGSQTFGVAASGTPIMLDYEFDGTAESYWFINGTLVYAHATSPSKTNASLSFFGWDGTTANNNFWSGRMHGCSTYNTVLSIAKIHAHYAATGLP